MSTNAKIVGYCRACGKALDESNVRTAHGTIYCEEHLPMTPSATSSLATASADATTLAIGPPPLIPGPADTSDSPYTSKAPPAVPQSDASPGLAFVLGLIPGVGAIYNGQYAKGLVHVIIIGLVISVLSNGSAHGLEPLLSLMLAGFWFYMAFEAYHTAQRRQRGQLVDEFSSLLPTRGGASRFPVAPVVLIALGVIFLLDNLDLLDFSRALRYWPVALIALGGYMLYLRMSPPSGGGQA
jgi:cell wall-active antibiotic response 4TMS protein YvqF